MSAQYATIGTGALKNKVWWLDWAGFNMSENATKTFVTNNGLTVTATFSNVSAETPEPYVMNTWFGAILHLLYDFTDPSIKPALFQVYSNAQCYFTIKFTVSRNGVPVPFTLIAADAEGSDNHEITTLQTNGGVWQTIDFFRNSSQIIDPLTGCGTQQVQISNTYAGAPATGQNPVLATSSPSTNPLSVDILFDHGITTGGMAVAFGILESVDRGDLPASYGTSEHEILYNISNSCNYFPPFPYTSQIETPKIGDVAGDEDPIQYTDDNQIGVDEEGVSTFPPYDGSGSYSINVKVDNTTGGNAYLSGWFDYNRDGVFENSELVTATIANNATSATLTWLGLPAFLPKGTASGYGFRFRISSDQQAAQSATGFAKDGEVEDYFILSNQLCSIKIVAGPDTSICPGTSVQLNAIGGDQYSWVNSADLSNTNIANPIATPAIPATYIVTGMNQQGCEANDTVTINLRSLPIIVKSDDTTICKGSAINLFADGASSYTWNSESGANVGSGQTINVSPPASTKYYVLAKDVYGCVNKDSINVSIHSVGNFTVSPDNPVICKNDFVSLTASGGDDYSWLSNTGDVIGSGPNFVASPDQNQNYEVQIKDQICEVTDTIKVSVYVNDLPVTKVLKTNDITCTLSQATLQASGGISYLWDNLPGISDLTSPNPVVRPLQTTTYNVTITDGNGCSKKDSITVNADFASNISHFPIASAFTPNGDGVNDCFGLKYWGPIISLKMEIFNRWGERVFMCTDPTQCWDGNYKGVAQPTGGYVYQIMANTPCGTAFRKGTVLLIR